jgi:hypothetical protein
MPESVALFIDVGLPGREPTKLWEIVIRDGVIEHYRFVRITRSHADTAQTFTAIRDFILSRYTRHGHDMPQLVVDSGGVAHSLIAMLREDGMKVLEAR